MTCLRPSSFLQNLQPVEVPSRICGMHDRNVFNITVYTNEGNCTVCCLEQPSIQELVQAFEDDAALFHMEGDAIVEPEDDHLSDDLYAKARRCTLAAEVVGLAKEINWPSEYLTTEQTDVLVAGVKVGSITTETLRAKSRQAA